MKQQRRSFKMKILITGFEPFGGSPINPSEQVALALHGQTIAGAELLTAILPVDGLRGPQALLEALQKGQPDVVLCLGEAARRPVLSLERIAINLLDYRIPDNAGHKMIDEPVVEGGPAAYFATIPVREIYQVLLETGIPAELSLSAGAYLCNQVMYRLLHFITTNSLNIQAGFIHLPALPRQAALQQTPQPSMSLETSLSGVRTAIAVITGTRCDV